MMTEEEFEQKSQVMASRLDRLAAQMELMAETPSIRAALDRLAQINADISAGAESLAQIAGQQEALRQREAALAIVERRLKIKEFTFDQKVEEATGQLRASYASLVAADTALKTRVLNYAGMLSGFAPTIQALPDWPAIEQMLGVADAIPELRDEPAEVTTKDSWGGEKLQGSLTRSVPMAAMSSHDDLPLPTNKTPERSKRPRRGYRAAMRAAMARP
jgi:hypothetical protein